MLSIKHLSKQLDTTRALDDFSLDIAAGQLFGLLGPNGAGKTTLIRLIMGLLRPTSGEITLFDEFRPGDPAARSQIGYMPQQLAVYPGLSVLENLLFFGRLYQVNEDELYSRADELLAMVELEAVRDQLVATRCCASVSGSGLMPWSLPVLPSSSPPTTLPRRVTVVRYCFCATAGCWSRGVRRA